jgi:hypothetical protein
MKKNKHILKKISRSRIWLLVFSVFVCILLYNSTSLFLKRLKVWKKVENLKQEKATLLERKSTIQVKKESLETPFGKEAVFRERFNVALPGEEVIIVTDLKQVKDSELSHSSIINFFKGLFK